MAIPTVRFREIPNSTATTDIDTPAKRLADITGQAIRSTGAGNEANFGIVDISNGEANSALLTLLWDVTADGGNTQVENFKLWLSSNGFDVAASVIKFVPLSGADQTSPVNTENYIADAGIQDYTFSDMPESEPGTQNVFPSDEGGSMVLSTTSDDVIMWAMYAVIGDNETTGTYSGVTPGYELQFSFKFSYS